MSQFVSYEENEILWMQSLESFLLSVTYNGLDKHTSVLRYIASLSGGWKVVAPREIVHQNSWDKLSVHPDSSWIIRSLDHHKYLANGQVYDLCHNPFSLTLCLSLFLSLSIYLSIYLSLSICLCLAYSFPFSIKDVTCFWEVSLNKCISPNLTII